MRAIWLANQLSSNLKTTLSRPDISSIYYSATPRQYMDQSYAQPLALGRKKSTGYSRTSLISIGSNFSLKSLDSRIQIHSINFIITFALPLRLQLIILSVKERGLRHLDHQANVIQNHHTEWIRLNMDQWRDLLSIWIGLGMMMTHIIAIIGIGYLN